MSDVNKDFFFKYMNANAPSGYEYSGQKIWMDYVKQYSDEIITRPYGNVIAVVNGSSDFKVVIEAHSDEISWGVNYITKEGYIYVDRNGGSDYDIAPGMRGYVHLDNGEKILGVFGLAPIHIKRKSEDHKLPNIENVVFDCGCESDKEVLEKGIHPGSIITFVGDLQGINNDKYYICRAFDNRAGGIAIAEVARKLKENNIKLPFTLYVCNCVQEEVGLLGARMAADFIKPDLAICTDVCHDTQSPYYNKIKDGDLKCGNGPVVTYSTSIHIGLRKLIERVAKNTNINIQLAFSSGTTYTDTDAFAYRNGGTPSALISLATKYLHSPVEMISYKDLHFVIELIYNVLLNIDANFNKSNF